MWRDANASLLQEKDPHPQIPRHMNVLNAKRMWPPQNIFSDVLHYPHIQDDQKHPECVDDTPLPLISSPDIHLDARSSQSLLGLQKFPIHAQFVR